MNAILELLPSFLSLPEDVNFYLNSEESNEFQTQSSEVLGVGFSVSLITKLFSINRNRIAVLEGTRKRCDLTFIKIPFSILLSQKEENLDNRLRGYQ